MKKNQKISIVGTGNVAFHLAEAFTKNGIAVSHVYGRNKNYLTEFHNRFGSTIVRDFNDFPQDQIVIICVPDDIISTLLEKFNIKYRIAYTSGSVDIDNLPSRENIGVFYPLQTFSKDSELDYSEIPFFIEANNVNFQSELVILAKSLSKTVSLADSNQRKSLHLSAVWVNNFTNHILYQAQDIADKLNVDFNHLLPLLEETIAKLKKDGAAYNTQTGPARRGDNKIIDLHLSELKDDQKEIYRAISDSIIKTYKNDEL